MTGRRVNAGVPAGGQFAAQSRAEADLDLEENDAPVMTDHVYSPNLPGLDVRSGDPVGYTYRAENLSGPDLVARLIGEQRLSPGARGMSAEDALDQLAAVEFVERDDETSYDSDQFPKTVFFEQLECSDQAWAGELAPPHVGFLRDEFPECVRCGAELS